MTNGLGAADRREAERLALLKYLDAARPEADTVLQGIVDDVRRAFGTDLALVNLVLPEEQYFRAWSGDLPEEFTRARRAPREHSVCARVVETGEPLVVEDFLDREGLRNQYFRVNHGTRFYAGVPLVARRRESPLGQGGMPPKPEHGGAPECPRRLAPASSRSSWSARSCSLTHDDAASSLVENRLD